MFTYTFKSNIACGGCIAKVSPFLNNEKEIEKWEVNTGVPDKILTISTSLTEEQITELVKRAGYTLTRIS